MDKRMDKRLDSLLSEAEVLRPPEAVRRAAGLQDYEHVYAHSLTNNEAFWEEVAQDFVWTRPWQRVLDWRPPEHRWFVGGETNITLNALDRHVAAGRGDKAAYIWLGEDGRERRVSYRELLELVCRLANGLKSLGVGKGDRVVIYMPLTLEGVASMLACARIGAVHSVVYAGFAAGALRARIEDAGAKLLIAGDVSYRRGKEVDLVSIVDDAVEDLELPVVRSRRRAKRALGAGEVDFGSLLEHDPVCEAERVDAEDPLFILYSTSH